MTWRTVRVFLSSTFKDMNAERDWLTRFVFPRLREELARLRIDLVDIDLRWGVTSEGRKRSLLVRGPRFARCELEAARGKPPGHSQTTLG